MITLDVKTLLTLDTFGLILKVVYEKYHFIPLYTTRILLFEKTSIRVFLLLLFLDPAWRPSQDLFQEVIFTLVFIIPVLNSPKHSTRSLLHYSGSKLSTSLLTWAQCALLSKLTHSE